MTDTIGIVAFLSVFHIIGGVVLGLSLRKLALEPSPGTLLTAAFTLVWGGLFGGIPLAMSVLDPRELAGIPTYIIQLVVFVAAIIAPMLLYEALRELLADKNVRLVGVGGIMFLLGAAFSGLMFSQGIDVGGLLVSGAFVVVGAGLVITGLTRTFGGSSDQASDGDGTQEHQP